MKKILFSVVFAYAFSISSLFAAPAAPIETIVSQPDGTTFTVRARGDEHANWIETTIGHTVIKRVDTWYYAEINSNGGLEASNSRVGSLDAIQIQQLPLHLAPSRDSSMIKSGRGSNLQRLGVLQANVLDQSHTLLTPEFSDSASFGGPQMAQALPHTQYVLTILVSYSNAAITNTDASFQSLIYGGSNSVKDFYLQNSYNGFTVTAPVESQGVGNDGIIRVSRGVNHPNQGSDISNSETEAREIVQLADPYINYADYDADGNGTISAGELAIVIITAGYETAYGGSGVALTPNVWGHKSTFATSISLDGKILSPYTMFGEKHGNHQATIGIMNHELGHLMLDLPDLYDTDPSEPSYGIGNWGLMAGGSWNRVVGFEGSSPAHLSAWSKVASKFTVPEDIEVSQNAVSIAQAETSEVAKRIWVDKYRSHEYFLIENRQKTGYDAGLPGAGLLIWHIDERQFTNGDENHKLVDLEEADGLAQLDSRFNFGDSGDPFPGSSNKTTFDNGSNPNSKNYAGANTSIGVTSISGSGPNMTANMANPTGVIGDHLRYDDNVVDSAFGLGSTTAWVGLRVLNTSDFVMFDGVDIFVFDSVGATIDIKYYSSMVNGVPSGLIHEQTGIAAGPFWNRLLLDSPQLFPAGAERGIVVKVVNNNSTHTIIFGSSDVASGRSYYSWDGNGNFAPLGAGDLSLVALMSGEDQAPVFTPAGAINLTQGSPESASVALGTVSDVELADGSLTVTQLGSGTATGVSVTALSNDNGHVTATLAASCTATSGTLDFSVSDGNQIAVLNLPVTISANTAPTFYYANISMSYGGASTHSTLFGILDNGTMDPPSLDSTGGFTGNISVTQSGKINISNAKPAGDHTIELSVLDNCNALTEASFTLSVEPVKAGAPTSVSATAGNAQASVSFTAPESNGGDAVWFYHVTSSPGNLAATGSSSPVAVSGLTNGLAYTFKVKAVNAAGDGPFSTASNSVIPIAPQTITFANPGGQSFGTTPTLSATATSGLSVSFSSSTTATCTITSGGALTFVTAGNCTIDANQSGSPAYEAADKVTQSFVVNAIVAGAPAMGVATAGDKQATVTFTPPATDGGAAISSYTVTSSPGNVTATASESPIMVTGLTNGQAYTFAVTATNTAGTGPASADSNSVTPIAEQTITFDNPGNQSFGTTPTLSATSTSGLSVSLVSTTAAVCTITASGTLMFVTTGNCSIDADQAGDEAWLSAQKVTQSFAVNAVVPSAPTAVTAKAGNALATVTFTPPVFDGGAAISSYTVTSHPGSITAVGAAPSITVLGLTNEVAYTFTVKATNSAGSGPNSDASIQVIPTDVVFIDSFE